MFVIPNPTFVVPSHIYIHVKFNLQIQHNERLTNIDRKIARTIAIICHSKNYVNPDSQNILATQCTIILFSDCGGPWISETAGSKTIQKEGLPYTIKTLNWIC